MSEPDPLVGQRVSNYEITRRLGQGGMGVVYLARHITLERDVAVKFLAGQLSTNPDYVERFLREARAAARLNHPNIIGVYDAGSEDDVYYFVMEFVEGRDLSQLLKKQKIFPEFDVIGYGIKAASALAYAHKAGIAHRDIKPENLIIAKDGELKVGDLGLAKQLNDEGSSLTMSGVVMGTPYYISPEQIRGAKDVDARTDIYSLGATLYHLLTGQVPYRGNSSAEIMSKHLTEPFPWPKVINTELSDGICHVLYKMMAKDPAERFQSMDEVAQVLQQMHQGDSSQVAAGINVSQSGIAVDPRIAATQMGAMPSAMGATGPAQAAPSVYPGQSMPGQAQPTMYTIPPTAVATRVGGIIGVCVIVGCILIGGVIFFTNKKQPKVNFDESAKRLELLKGLDLSERKNDEVARRIEKTEKPPDATSIDKGSPLPPPSTETPVPPAVKSEESPLEKKVESVAEKPVEKPAELAMAKPPSNSVPTVPSPKVLVDSDFESDDPGSLPKAWRVYIQETVAKGETSKAAHFETTSTTYETPDKTKVTWEIFQTQEAADGSHVMRIINKPADNEKFKYRSGINCFFAVEANKKYLLTFSARAGNEPIKGGLRFGKPPTMKDLKLELTDEWKEIRVPFEPSESSDQISLSITLTSPGEMWIDQVKVVQKD